MICLLLCGCREEEEDPIGKKWCSTCHGVLETWALESPLHYLRRPTDQVSYWNLSFLNGYSHHLFFFFFFFFFISFLVLGSSKRNLEPNYFNLLLNIQYSSLPLFPWYVLKITYTHMHAYLHI